MTDWNYDLVSDCREQGSIGDTYSSDNGREGVGTDSGTNNVVSGLDIRDPSTKSLFRVSMN